VVFGGVQYYIHMVGFFSFFLSVQVRAVTHHHQCGPHCALSSN